MTDDHALERFVAAQDGGGTYDRALSELRRGGKKSHWMWFVFPQIAGLGSSATARQYAIGSLAEAQAYLSHPVLGPRLLACTTAVCGLDETDPERVLGAVDARKLQSSMTLFHLAAPDEPAFRAVLDKYFDGRLDQATLDRL